MTQPASSLRIRRITEVDICTPVETGWSCRHQGTAAEGLADHVEVADDLVVGAQGRRGATITPAAPMSITAFVELAHGGKAGRRRANDDRHAAGDARSTCCEEGARLFGE